METSPDSTLTQAALDEFQVSLGVFEGPFDLLLQLISRNKLIRHFSQSDLRNIKFLA